MTIKLRKPEDWDTWISFVRMRATNLDIWALINPELPTKPVALDIPIKPNFDPGAFSADSDRVEHHFYEAHQHLYKSALAKYNEQSDAFASIIVFIRETITAQNAVLIQHVESHPYDYLKALRERLAPTDKARSLRFQTRYEELKKGPGNKNTEAWINEWDHMFVEASACNIAEVQEDRLVTDFLLAIMCKDEVYAAVQLSNLDQSGNPRTMHQITQNYRQYVRLQQAITVANQER